MIIQIYNSLTRKKEIFKPVKPGEIKIYVCGPTVYDLSHIGHARSAVIFDVVVKYFKSIGFKVSYIRNFTDVDDKIIARAKKKNISCYELAQMNINSFTNDMKVLGVDSADEEPRVTNHIDDIVNFINVLIDNKSAYVKNGDVYFAVDTLNSYGKLSRRNKDDMIAGSRIKINKNKRNALDFTLWKSSKSGEPSWKSPWGYGRPGWHIECSTMSRKLLGQPIDIHGGGEDLIFPHHENEIAQSQSAYKKPLARYWMHHGMVNINDEKMSKSLDNWTTIKDVTKLYHPEVVRLFLLSSHYRSPINFSKQSLDSCEKALTKAYRALDRASSLISRHRETNNTGILWNQFSAAMSDDFNTAKCIGLLFDAVKKINKIIDNEHKIAEIVKIVADLLLMGEILGILNLTPKVYFTQKRKHEFPKKKDIDHKKIEKLIDEREKMRINKNWVEADKIRIQLINMNVVVEDRSDGTAWKIVN